MTEEQKIFDDFPQVDCNTCRTYTLDQCDGVPVGETRKCTTYQAVRHTDLPVRIEKLEKRMKGNERCNFLTCIALFIYLLGQLIGTFL